MTYIEAEHMITTHTFYVPVTDDSTPGWDVIVHLVAALGAGGVYDMPRVTGRVFDPEEHTVYALVEITGDESVQCAMVERFRWAGH